MKKKKLFSTTVASLMLATVLSSSTAGASSVEDITKHYNVNSTTPPVNVISDSAKVANSSLTVQEQQILNELLNKIQTTGTSTQEKVLNFTNLDSRLQALKEQEDTYTSNLVSNDDSIRRSALESIFGVSLSGVDDWNNDGKVNSDGQTYTSVEDMKKDYIYGINASREALVRTAIKDGNWQPYRWFSAMSAPSHFDLVNGKLEYNKNYYAYMADYYLTGLYKDALNWNSGAEQTQFNKMIYEKELKATIDAYNNAPGYAVYSPFLHHVAVGTHPYNVLAFNPDYTQSVWNNFEVRRGKPVGGVNPYKVVVKALNEGNYAGNLSNGVNSVTDKQGVNVKVDNPTKTSTQSQDITAPVAVESDENLYTAVTDKAVVNDSAEETVENETSKKGFFGNFVAKVKSIANLD